MPMYSSVGPRWFHVSHRWGGGRGPRRRMSTGTKVVIAAVLLVMAVVGTIIDAVNGPETQAASPAAINSPTFSVVAACSALTQGWSDLQGVVAQGDPAADYRQVQTYLATLQQYTNPSPTGQDQEDLQISVSSMYDALSQFSNDLQSDQGQDTNDYVSAAAQYANIDYVCTGA